MEQWKPVKGYEKEYEVSSLGRVRRLANVDGDGKYENARIVKPVKVDTGYDHVGLWKGNKCQQVLLHQLVASHFLPQPKSGETQVNHIDQDKHNNAASNLSWATPEYNTNYGDAIKRRVNSRYKNGNY